MPGLGANQVRGLINWEIDRLAARGRWRFSNRNFGIGRTEETPFAGGALETYACLGDDVRVANRDLNVGFRSAGYGAADHPFLIFPGNRQISDRAKRKWFASTRFQGCHIDAFDVEWPFDKR